MSDLSAAIVLFSLLIYLMLDGTDLGVAIILVCFNKEEDRHRLVQSILPVWDANETWIVLTAGALLALFPAAYSEIFSAVYVPLFMMLFCLFIRALALEYRGQASSRVRKLLDLSLNFSSTLTAFFQGSIAGLIVSGIPSTQAFAWLDLYPLLSGLGLVAIYALLGCCWMRWRVAGSLRGRTTLLTWLCLIVTMGLYIAIVLTLPDIWLKAVANWPGKALAFCCAFCWVSLLGLLPGNRPLLPLIMALLVMLGIAMMVMIALYPFLIPGRLELHEAAASPDTQRFVLTGIAIVMPFTLAYNSWAFWVFRGKVK